MSGERRTSARAAGFTLFEVLGVVLVTTLLLGVALDFYVDLSRQAVRASDHTREVRRASAILDRVANDLEHALLVRKPPETDPLFHPWLFLAESDGGGTTFGEEGSHRVKFVRRDVPRASDLPVPDLVMVAYTLEVSEGGEGFELRRWSRPGLPEGLDREFPLPGDPESLLVTDEIAYFATRFLDTTGAWQPSWDSSQLVDSSELPLAVEIELALVPSHEIDVALGPEAEPRHFLRQVQLPLRPIDLQALLEEGDGEDGLAGGNGEGDEADYEGLTLADCIDFSQVDAGAAAASGLSATDLGTLTALAQQAGDTPFGPYAGLLAGHPAVRPQCR